MIASALADCGLKSSCLLSDNIYSCLIAWRWSAVGAWGEQSETWLRKTDLTCRWENRYSSFGLNSLQVKSQKCRKLKAWSRLIINHDMLVLRLFPEISPCDLSGGGATARVTFLNISSWLITSLVVSSCWLSSNKWHPAKLKISRSHSSVWQGWESTFQ